MQACSGRKVEIPAGKVTTIWACIPECSMASCNHLPTNTDNRIVLCHYSLAEHTACCKVGKRELSSGNVLDRSRIRSVHFRKQLNFLEPNRLFSYAVYQAPTNSNYLPRNVVSWIQDVFSIRKEIVQHNEKMKYPQKIQRTWKNPFEYHL